MTTLLVANEGGHITQLHRMMPRLGIRDGIVWVTTRTPQTESLLAGETVHWTGPADPRDVGHVMANARAVRSVLRRYDVSQAISTGASLALSALPQASMRGIPAYYIESATRTQGPSRSGALLTLVPTVNLFTQHQSWAGGRWRFAGSPFDVYDTETLDPSPLRRAVVTLGTQGKYGFRRALERIRQILPDDVEVLWQTGGTDASGLGIDAREAVPYAELQHAVQHADVVITHAGTGAVLGALDAGQCPVVLPRRSCYGEHVDDHQLQTASEVGQRGLAVVRDPVQLSLSDIYGAAARRVVQRSRPPLLNLTGTERPVPALAG